MKTLNFTTPEQSKRLLELGVPADSADCYNTTKHIGIIPDGATYKDVWQMSIWRDEDDNHIEMYPCWSVGRLIEILEIILGSPWSDKELLGKQGTLLERVVSDFEDVVKYKEIFKDNRIDFSKLEE